MDCICISKENHLDYIRLRNHIFGSRVFEVHVIFRHLTMNSTGEFLTASALGTVQNYQCYFLSTNSRQVGGSVPKTPMADNFYICDFSAFFLSLNTKIADNLGLGGWVRPCLLLADNREH